MFPYYTDKEQKVLNAQVQRIKVAIIYVALRMKILEKNVSMYRETDEQVKNKILLLWRHTQKKKIKHLPTKPRDDLQ